MLKGGRFRPCVTTGAHGRKQPEKKIEKSETEAKKKIQFTVVTGLRGKGESFLEELYCGQSLKQEWGRDSALPPSPFSKVAVHGE